MRPNWRIIVTGAGGFVGRHIVDVVKHYVGQVIAVDTHFDHDLRLYWSQEPNIQLIENDVLAYSERADALIHAAAITTQPDDKGYTPEKHLSDNLIPTLHLLEWGYTQQIGRMIFISSDAVYSISDAGIIHETQLPNPLGTYAVAKTATEQMAHTLKTVYGRDILTIRLSGVYGTGEFVRPSRPYISPILHFVHTALTENKITIQPKRLARAWTFAPDIGEAICTLLWSPTLAHALYNIATEECLTERQIAQAIQHHLPDVQIIEVDDMNPVSLRQGHLSHAQLYKETGFASWTPFQAGIGQVIAWQSKKIQQQLS